MSLQRLGVNPDGSRHIVYGEPARARVSGFGGTMASHAITPMRSPWARPAPHTRMDHINERARCGKILPKLREPCYRRAGHRDDCRSMASVMADTDRRRRWDAERKAFR